MIPNPGTSAGTAKANADSASPGSGCNLGFCISTRQPDVAGAAGPGQSEAQGLTARARVWPPHLCRGGSGQFFSCGGSEAFGPHLLPLMQHLDVSHPADPDTGPGRRGSVLSW